MTTQQKEFIPAIRIAHRRIKSINSTNQTSLTRGAVSKVNELTQYLNRRCRWNIDLLSVEEVAANKYMVRGDGGSFAIINLEPIN